MYYNLIINMSRQEQIQKAAKSYANKSICDKGIAYLEFIEAVEWADATLIEKACEYLESSLKHDLGYYGTAEFVNAFRKAMED